MTNADLAKYSCEALDGTKVRLCLQVPQGNISAWPAEMAPFWLPAEGLTLGLLSFQVMGG